MKKIILATSIMAATSAPAMAATTATAAGDATATIIAPLTLDHDVNRQLDFGVIEPGAAGGSVTVDPTSTGTTGAVSGVTQLGTTASDRFVATGEAGRVIDISATGGSLSGGGAPMPFTVAVSDAQATLGDLGANTAEFFVGGTLTVNSGQAAGTYTGTYDATVAYN